MSETIPITNIVNDKPIDRIYGNLHGTKELVQKDGSIYQGRIMDVQTDGRKWSLAEDGRWFDNSGMPTDCPNTANTSMLLKVLKANIKKADKDNQFEEYKKKFLGKVGK
tara:strand:- start:168 stop:494 length:327 start_codon:yes stop_codon:yes gene_type:complete